MMRYILPILPLVILLVFVMSGCRKSVELAPFTSFCFLERNTMAINRDRICKAEVVDGKTFATIRMEDMSEEDEVTIEISTPLMDSLYAIAEKHDLKNGMALKNTTHA